MNNVPSGKTRRAFLTRTAAVLAVPLLLTTRKSAAQTPPLVPPPSPPTTPWQDPLPNTITWLDPINALTPSPTEAPNLVAGLGAAALGGLVGRRAAAAPEHARHVGTRAAALPNVPLVTHEGQAVTFYDDLIRSKVVAINMMYAECEGICPLATSNLVRVQELLGERVGRDVFLYSLTWQPELDTPQRLQEYAVMHGVKPGWLFLTGARADIERLRYRLGFFDPNPVVDRDKATHGHGLHRQR